MTLDNLKTIWTTGDTTSVISTLVDTIMELKQELIINKRLNQDIESLERELDLFKVSIKNELRTQLCALETKLESNINESTTNLKSDFKKRMDTVKTDIESRMDTNKSNFESRLGAVKAAIETRMDTDKAAIESRMDTDKAAIESRMDTDKAAIESRMDTDKADIESRMDTDKAAIELRMDTDKTNLESRMDTDKAAIELRMNTVNSDARSFTANQLEHFSRDIKTLMNTNIHNAIEYAKSSMDMKLIQCFNDIQNECDLKLANNLSEATARCNVLVEARLVNHKDETKIDMDRRIDDLEGFIKSEILKSIAY